jgi:hypothetical protein
MMKNKKISLMPLLAALLAAFLLYACDFPGGSGEERERPPQTRILNVLVQPDTVAPGDTTRFTCIIEDSTDERFEFSWLIEEGEVLGAVLIDGENSEYLSDTNNIQWIAPSSERDYLFAVFANNGSEDSLSVNDGFRIVVE